MRRKHRRLEADAELDITTFMNLMIVLVPVLLLSMVFTQTSIIDLRFPELDGLAQRDPESWQLQVILRDGQVQISDSKAGQLALLPHVAGQPDYAALRAVLQQVKARVPDKKDVVLLPESTIDYQTLVTVMDTLRSYPTTVVASLVQAELFPDIALGDAPPLPQAGGVP